MMTDYRRIVLFASVMSIIAGAVALTAITVLYDTALEQQRARLVEIAQSQARLMEAVARFDQAHSQHDHPSGAEAATLAQVVDAHNRYPGFGATGEFTLAKREAANIVFLLRHRRSGLDKPAPVPFHSNLAEPMRRALLGQSGTVVGLDYSGTMVLGAYEPVDVLNLGLVAKIDLAEIRAPFRRAVVIVAAIALVLISAGTWLVFYIGNPMVRHIKESEQRFRAISTVAPDAIVLMNSNGDVSFWNDSANEMFGYNAEEAIGQSLADLIIPERYRDRHRQGLARMAHTQGRPQRMHTMELEGLRKDGTEFPIEVSLSVITSDGSWEAIGVVRDVTERKRAERTLQEQQQFTQRVLNESLAGLYIYNVDERRNDFVNAQYTKLTGYQLDELRAMTGGQFARLFHPEDRDEVSRHIDEVCRAPEGQAIELEYRFKTKSGAWIWCLSRDSVFERKEDGGVRRMIGTFLDFTERRQAEEQVRERDSQLAHMDRLSAMGELATGIAHEVNQPLTAIVSYAQGLARRVKSGNGHGAGSLEALEQISAMSKRASDIIRGLRRLVRREEGEKALLQVNEIVSDTLRLLYPQVRRRGIAVELRLAPDLPSVCVNGVQLEQVVLNLIRNSIDALAQSSKEGRTIKVITFVNERNDVELTVSDNGIGLSEADTDRIFDAFVSTKEEGMGLGLSICRTILETHGGRIWASAKSPHGASFHVALPAKHDASECA